MPRSGCFLRNKPYTSALPFSKTAKLQDLTGFGNLSGRTDASRQFGNLFNAYAKAFNKMYDRFGSLFCRPFRRIQVASGSNFVRLVNYIHRNPQHHGFVNDFREWPHSSYHTILARGSTRLQREAVMGWYGGREAFIDAHIYDGDELEDAWQLEDA